MKIIEIKEEITIGNSILEVGDKIKVLESVGYIKPDKELKQVAEIAVKQLRLTTSRMSYDDWEALADEVAYTYNQKYGQYDYDFSDIIKMLKDIFSFTSQVKIRVGDLMIGDQVKLTNSQGVVFVMDTPADEKDRFWVSKTNNQQEGFYINLFDIETIL